MVHAERCFYLLLITLLAILSILLPVIIIETSSSSPRKKKKDSDKHKQDKDKYKYFEIDEFYEYIEGMVNRRNLLFTLNTIGKTQNNRPIHELILDRKGKNTVKPRVVIVSGLSGKDCTSVVTSIRLMDNFYFDGQGTKKLMKDYSLRFIPLLNPDGYHLAATLPIHANWGRNYEGTYSNHTPKGTSVTNMNANSPELKILKEYFTNKRNEFEAAFFLFSPEIIWHNSTSYFYLHKELTANNTAEAQFLDDVMAALQKEGVLNYKYEKDIRKFRLVFNNETKYKMPHFKLNQTIDNWVADIKLPHYVLVGNFFENFRAQPPENIVQTTKIYAAEIHFIINKLLRLWSESPFFYHESES